jgi:hypothetical protein
MAQVAISEIKSLTRRALDALLDAEIKAACGSPHEAAFQIQIALGLLDGDAIELVGEDQMRLRMELPEIRARVDRALALKAQGLPTALILVKGLSP